MNRYSAVILLLLIGLSGCNHTKTELSSPANTLNTTLPSISEASAPDMPRFQDIADSAGLHYRWEIPGKRPLNILQTIGNGCAFLDYNNDGNLDILLVGPKVALFQGDGRGHFTDVSAQMGLDKLSGNFLGCAVGDYDNDGFEDLYLSAYRGGVLLHNEKGQRFSDVTKQAGIASQHWGTSCAFVDIDGDGRLDLYICNYIQFSPETKPQLCDFSGIKGSCGPRYYQAEHGVLYHNEGNRRFLDVTSRWKATQVSGKGLGIACADFDGSGRQSIALANDEVPGDLLQNHRDLFKNIGVESGTALNADTTAHGGMGIDWGDYDNDGKLDLVVATFEHEAKCLYHNDGSAFFTERSSVLGLAEHTIPYIAFGAKFLDADNDSYLDLMFSNGHVQDNVADIDKHASYRQPIQLFWNRQGQTFEDLGARAGSIFERKIVGRGLAVGDFDNDGKMDALFVDSEGAPLLLHNETPRAGHWLLLKLEGVKSNRDGLGALLTIEAGGKTLLRRCATDGSYLSASDRRVHVGLGNAATADITVHWPGGATTRYSHLSADHIYTLREGDSTPR